MISFSCEEQDGRKRLVYQKKPDDELDTMTLEMMRNNKIEGLVPFDCIQIDQDLYMTYDITGLITVKEYLSGIVNRAKLFQVLESICAVLISSEEYLLELDSFVLHEQYIFLSPQTKKIALIVLPVRRAERRKDLFLKELFMNIRYDQTEDCSYVAELINLFSGAEEFSVYRFREQLIAIRNKKREDKKVPEQKAALPEWAAIPNAAVSPKAENAAVPIQEKALFAMTGSDMVKPEMSEDILPVITEEKKEKKGFFRKKQKEEKTEKQNKGKRGLFGKKAEKKSAVEEDVLQNPLFQGMAIPQKGTDKKTDQIPEVNIPNMVIPAQKVQLEKQTAVQQDFGETVYVGRDSEETIYLDRKQEIGKKRFILCRSSTKKTYEIIGDIVRIGRNPSATEICIDGNPGVGRVHAVLYQNGGQIYIADNRSKNRTYLNEIQINPDEEPKLLHHGDKIRLGDEELEFYVIE